MLSLACGFQDQLHIRSKKLFLNEEHWLFLGWKERQILRRKLRNWKWDTVIGFPHSENTVFWVTLLTLKGNDCVFLRVNLWFQICSLFLNCAKIQFSWSMKFILSMLKWEERNTSHLYYIYFPGSVLVDFNKKNNNLPLQLCSVYSKSVIYMFFTMAFICLWWIRN